MKELYLVRHAKAEKEGNANDFDRMLIERGKTDAALIGQALKKSEIVFDGIISSPAPRSKETTEIIINETETNADYVLDGAGLYMADADLLLKNIMQVPDNVNRLLIVGHNPGISNLASYLCKLRVESFSTSGVLGLRINASSWKSLLEAEKELMMMLSPRLVRN